MKKRLEEFVKDNLDMFDKFEPGPLVWNNIRQHLEKDTRSKKGILVSMKIIRWSAAAAIIILLGAGAYLFLHAKTQTPEVVNTGKK